MKNIALSIAAALLSFAAPGIAANEAPRPWKIAILLAQSGPSEDQTTRGLRDGLKELGYAERKNVVIEIDDLKGKTGGLDAAAADLARKGVDLIFTSGTRGTRAAMAATQTIPIVFRHPADPVAMGFVKSLERPGGNVTGVSAFSGRTVTKRFEILKEFAPRVRRAHIFYDSNNPFARENVAAAKKAGEAYGIEVIDHSIKTPDELKSALGALQKTDEEAIFEVSDDLVESQAELLFDAARQNGMPSIFEGADWAVKGSLLSYGANYYQMGRQAARLVNRIFRGEKPGNISAEPAKKYDLMVNLRMARAIGLSIPPETLKKADKVIR
jgi:putative tryptophan/tyrosine transport system substrate-binding protein